MRRWVSVKIGRYQVSVWQGLYGVRWFAVYRGFNRLPLAVHFRQFTLEVLREVVR